MPAKNLYGILGLSWGAEEQTIKSAYRHLAKALHPDHNPDNPSAAERFKEVAAAYYVLSDPVRRVAYMREHGFESILQRAQAEKQAENGFEVPQTGPDITVRLSLSLEEIASGITKRVKIRRQSNCSACSGTGFEGGQTSSICPACHGTRRVPDLLRLRRGLKGATMPCRKCNGTGTISPKTCPVCSGRRRAIRDHFVNISVPAGIEDQHQMAIKGQGHDGIAGGSAGDIKIIVQQKPHPYLERRGCDLVYHCTISVTEWMEGADLRLPSLNGEVRLKITPGLRSEGTLRILARGLPGPGGVRGDFLVQYRLQLPPKLSRKQLTILKRLEELPGFSPARDSRGYFPREI